VLRSLQGREVLLSGIVVTHVVANLPHANHATRPQSLWSSPWNQVSVPRNTARSRSSVSKCCPPLPRDDVGG
jgi:hypothetical protein